MAFQHLTQKAYLEHWKLGSNLYLINKHTGEASPCQSAKRILGMYDVQTPEMEAAFSEVESCIGNLHTTGELTDPHDKRMLAKWVALHAIRCAKNVDKLPSDYTYSVEHMADYFQRHHCFFLDSPKPAFITCDNPCLYLLRDGIPFWFIPASPFRCACFSPITAYAQSPPWDVNKNTLRAASDYCVSFDGDLHTTRESLD